MKTLILATFFFALMILNINAQTEANSGFLISVDNTKVLYEGVDNPVSILVSGAVDKNIKVAISDGTIIPQGNGKYIVKVNPGVKTIPITISAFKTGIMTKLGTEVFKVKPIPSPNVYIANKRNAVITKDEILNNPILTPQLENFDFFPNIHFTITEFSISAYVNGNLTEKHATGDKLTESMIDVIKNNVAKRQTIYFDNIKAKGPGGTIRNLESFNLTIE